MSQLWHLDVEYDPETYPLMLDMVDYLNEKLSSKIKNKIANIAGANADRNHTLPRPTADIRYDGVRELHGY